jgi:hypothetical protein
VCVRVMEQVGHINFASWELSSFKLSVYHIYARMCHHSNHRATMLATDMATELLL